MTLQKFKFILLFVLIIVFNSCNFQVTSNTDKKNKTEFISTDSIKAQFLYELVEKFSKDNNYEKAIETLSLAFESVNFNSQKNLVNNLYQIRTKLYIENYDIAIKQLELHLLDDTIFNNLSKAHTYNNLAVAYYYKGDYKTAIVHSFRATKLFETEDNKYALVNSYNNLGHLYYKMNQYQKAIYNLKKTIYLSDSLQNDYVKATALNNIGLVYLNVIKNDSAIFYLHQAERIKIRIKSTNLASTYQSLSSVLLNVGKSDEALSYLNQALALNKKNNNKNGIIHDHLSLGNYFFKKKDYFKAKLNYEKGLYVAKKINNLDLLVRLKLRLGNLYKISGNYKTAFRMHELAHKLKDSLNKEKQQSLAIQAQIRYETEKKERELAVTKQKLAKKSYELERQKWFRILGIVSSVALLFIIYILWYKSKTQKIFSQQKIQEIQSSLSQTKAQLLSKQKMHDILSKKLESESTINKEKLKLELIKSQKEIRDLEIFYELREQMQRTINKGGKDTIEVKQLKEMISNLFIEQKHKKLITSLKQEFPTLTDEDLRLCAAIKQSLLNAEISMFLQISTNTLYTRKSRLKQKFNLSPEVSLNDFIDNFIKI